MLALRALIVALLAAPALAQPAPQGPGACEAAIAAAEPGAGRPPGLLTAIALVESGRRDPRTGRIAPWPWAINATGDTAYAPSRAAAVAEVNRLRAAGTRSIDVGCMQISLLHHPNAFASVDLAFDPAANVAYAVRFLRQLRERTGDWGRAVAQYHSGDAERGQAYRRRLALAGLAEGFGNGRSPAAVQLPAETGGWICPAGLRPVLLLNWPAQMPVGSAARRVVAPPSMVCRPTPRIAAR